jgi:UDP-3-O-[3-hydroxymyristoyl] glucosamine N-acyltransferase
MIDSRFFKKSSSFTLRHLADICGAKISYGSDENLEIVNVSSLAQAGSGEISFLDNLKYRSEFVKTQASACIVHPDAVKYSPQGLGLLVTPAPYKAYARVAQAFYPEPNPEPHIAPTAIIHPTAHIAKDCVIEDFVVIKAGAKIGEGSWLETGAVIGENVEIGQKARIGIHASVTHAILGDHVRLYPGARVGQDGFGFAIDQAGYIKIPQLGRVIIGSHVEIGANTTIDRGSGPDTVIGDGCWIDNLVQIGHNVKLGRGCIVAAQSGISGSTELGDYVMAGGQSGFAGHLKIGKGARIAAQSGVIRDIEAGAEHMGTPSQPLKQFLRQHLMSAHASRKKNND